MTQANNVIKYKENNKKIRNILGEYSFYYSGHIKFYKQGIILKLFFWALEWSETSLFISGTFWYDMSHEWTPLFIEYNFF